MKRNKQYSIVSRVHYGKMLGRFLLLLSVIWVYIKERAQGNDLFEAQSRPLILSVIWVIYMVEMILRFFPSKRESPGCQKVFRSSFRPAAKIVAKPTFNWRGTLTVVVAWLALNGTIGALFMRSIIDKGILLIISLCYSVCDMICILWFCPFQTWMMGNRCCTTCRIYNWDFAMMFTPLSFIKSPFTWSLVAMALALFIHWEVTFRRHPERFSNKTNLSLRCVNCTEKLCLHKETLKMVRR